ncbi:Uncharacterised protein [Vibrio cholerae]|nr:Uncharacterised protein [Vibrio cholerae]
MVFMLIDILESLKEMLVAFNEIIEFNVRFA